MRWCDNFATRHGRADLTVGDGRVVVSGDDGATAVLSLPFARRYDGPPDPAALAAAAVPPERWGVLLVRKGGFAVALVAGDRVLASKVGQRHVQGRTKAGGQSQQRFARRRDNQARQAYEAAAEHAHRVLVLEAAAPPAALVCGGDRQAVEAGARRPAAGPAGRRCASSPGCRCPTRAGRCSTRPCSTARRCGPSSRKRPSFPRFAGPFGPSQGKALPPKVPTACRALPAARPAGVTWRQQAPIRASGEGTPHGFTHPHPPCRGRHRRGRRRPRLARLGRPGQPRPTPAPRRRRSTSARRERRPTSRYRSRSWGQRSCPRGSSRRRAWPDSR